MLRIRALGFPSNILAEVDRKIDDGIANAGDMRFNSVDPYADGKTTTTTGSAVNCMRKFDGGGLVGTKAPINDLSVLEWRGRRRSGWGSISGLFRRLYLFDFNSASA